MTSSGAACFNCRPASFTTLAASSIPSTAVLLKVYATRTQKRDESAAETIGLMTKGLCIEALGQFGAKVVRMF